ncbi:MAG TPA: sterol desaturase family protein [Burkholderiales bacterium]|nr:sterol desaturase family protein [Burkholderiales bacterium]
METLFRLIEPVQTWLFETVVQPLLFHFGFMSYIEDAYDATGDVVLALGEIALLYVILRPLEAWRPVERWKNRDDVWPDVIYTFLYKTGALPLIFFLLLTPPLGELDYLLRDAGYVPPNLEEWLPWLGTHPIAALLTYIVIIDFFEYWRHRLQHRFNWWWALHAVHHSQRTMSFWADDRNHVLDGLIEALWLALVAQLVGVSGAQFVGIVFVFTLVESLSHANLRFNFGVVGERTVVSPLFHRVHHGIGVGHEGDARGCNFATLFPVWDMLFGTANFMRTVPRTGIRDQLHGADYGAGFLDQQWKGFVRLALALAPARRSPPRSSAK